MNRVAFRRGGWAVVLALALPAQSCAKTVFGASAGAAHWALQQAPKPAEPGGSVLLGVSCRSRVWCMAVGGPVTAKGRMFGELWDGRRWSLLRVPGPPGTSATTLNGISCTSTAECVAVGTFTQKGRTEALVERWHDGVWRFERTPRPVSFFTSTLDGVSCVSSMFCAAAGAGNDGESDYVSDNSVQEIWNGTNWSVKKDVDPNDNVNYDLFGVSCASAKACLAVGFVAERWNGSAWSLEQIPTKGGLAGVSCPSTSSCFAVGAAPGRHGDDVPLVMRWSS